MKKITLLSLSILFFVKLSYSQNEKSFNFGLYGAPGVSWLKSDTKGIDGDGLRLNFAYGLMIDIILADNYALSTGVEPSYTGGKLSWKNGDTTHFATYKLQYFDIPLTLKMQTNEVNYMTFYGRFGGSLGTRTKAIGDFTSKYDSNSKTIIIEDENINRDINLFRISFIIGAGMEYSLGGNTRAIVGLNYKNGLTDTFKGKDIKAKNNTIAVTLGIIF